MEEKIFQISAVNELAGSLTQGEVKKIVSFLNPPARLFESVHDGTSLLDSLGDWDERNPDKIHQAIESVRPDLMSTVRKIHWSNAPSELDLLNPIQTLIHILKTEIETEQWIQIGFTIPAIRNEFKVESKLRILASEGYIAPDLEILRKLMRAIKREDIGQKVKQLKHSFREMSNIMFINQFLKEIATIERNLEEGRECLRKFIITLNRKLKQVLDDEEDVDIESVYIPLTIVKQKPREVKLEDETTYNEIKFLRKIANKEVQIIPVDFKEELMQYDASTPQIWCLIGNPGSGKTFLCHRTAIRFGTNELSQFSYCVTIPCRHQEWHQMEQSREKAGLSVNGDFIQEWLSLSMPIGPSWTKQLSKHILETDGHQLLIIIDSLDEFTQQVLFQNTLLFLLLNRRCLTQSTIILTSRPGAYTSISSSHDLKIDRFYQVLGFSPENRDKYFISQLKIEDQLKQLEELFHLHEELKQLTLVPVNASLFASLIRGSDSIHAQTLTYLYSELVTYLIRRQLSRMNLTTLAKKTTLFNLPPNVLECLFEVGELAYFGVSTRQLTSSKDILLKVGKREKRCQCLGLAQEYFKRDEEGVIIRVWSFAHLTIQEFVGAVWLKMSSVGDQCLSVRYIIHSDEYFAIFKMVIRFICGLLAEKSNHILYIMHKYLPATPIPIEDMPQISQLNIFCSNSKHMGWIKFTQNIVLLSEMLFETNSDTIKLSSNFLKFLPPKLYFYLSTISPNEWNCFVKFLGILPTIQLIYFETSNVTPNQFRFLLKHLTSSSVSSLALKLERNKDLSTLSSYTQILESELPSKIKVSLELSSLKSDSSTFTVHNIPSKLISSVCLSEFLLPQKFLQQISNQMIRSDFKLLAFFYTRRSETLVSRLDKATQLTALHLHNMPDTSKQQLKVLLPKLTNLQEITLGVSDFYSLLSLLSKLSKLNYLNLYHGKNIFQYRNTTETVQKYQLTQLLSRNQKCLRVFLLSRLCLTESKSGDKFLDSLCHCTNMVQLELSETTLEPEDIDLWGKVVNNMKYLVKLSLADVSISDPGLVALCTGLIKHPTIRYIKIYGNNLTSASCFPLINLIPTLLEITTIDIEDDILSDPEDEPFELLKQTAAQFSVNLETF